MIAERGSRAGTLFVAALIMAYPLIVFLLLDRVGPGALGLALGVLLGVRFLISRERLPGLAFAVVLTLVVIAAALSIAGPEAALKAYPAALNIGLLIVFGHTLLEGPPMLERISQASGIEVRPEATGYLRGLTLIWCVFFGVNALISAAITSIGSLSAWTLYNGLIAYVLVGALIGGEILYRRVYLRRLDTANGRP